MPQSFEACIELRVSQVLYIQRATASPIYERLSCGDMTLAFAERMQ